LEETVHRPLKIVHHEVVYEDRNQSIQRVTASFDGFNKEYFVADHGERVALIALRDGCVLLTRQYRLIIDDISFEVPGGGLGTEESPEVGAARECREETGVVCTNLRPLLCFHPGMDICRNYTRVFWTDECSDTDEIPDNRKRWVPLAGALEMVESRNIVDGLSIAGILAISAHLMGGARAGSSTDDV
jgi:ADP-ribose pyrophosphatase